MCSQFLPMIGCSFHFFLVGQYVLSLCWGWYAKEVHLAREKIIGWFNHVTNFLHIYYQKFIQQQLSEGMYSLYAKLSMLDRISVVTKILNACIQMLYCIVQERRKPEWLFWLHEIKVEMNIYSAEDRYLVAAARQGHSTSF